MTYALVLDGNYLYGYATPEDCIAEIESWGEPTLAVTDNFDGYCDKIVNEESGNTVCYLTNRIILDHFRIDAGDDFIYGNKIIGTYSDNELSNLS